MEYELIIAFSAIFISLVSLIASIIFSRKSQEHNRKSVLPIPYLDRSDYEDHIHIKIYNKGTGPLIANELKAITESGDIGYIIDLVPEPPDGFHFSNFSKFTENEPRTIPPGQSNDLLVADFDLNDSAHIDFRNDLRISLKKLTISLEYTDVYNSKFNNYITDCSWFGRHSEQNKNTPLARI